MIEFNSNIILTEEEKNKRIDKIKNNFHEILSTLGYDVEDPQLKDTPNRIAKAWVNDLLSGSFSAPPKITVFPNTEKTDSIVMSDNIEVKSMCAHHFLSFIGTACVAYIPKDNIIGISKLGRVVDWFSRRPQNQESLTKQIADYIEEKTGSNDVAVVINATHLCMTIRGAEQPLGTSMKTSEMRGAFRSNESTRNEFFQLLKLNGGLK